MALLSIYWFIAIIRLVLSRLSNIIVICIVIAVIISILINWLLKRFSILYIQRYFMELLLLLDLFLLLFPCLIFFMCVLFCLLYLSSVLTL
jgi:hypothetical protein